MSEIEETSVFSSASAPWGTFHHFCCTPRHCTVQFIIFYHPGGHFCGILRICWHASSIFYSKNAINPDPLEEFHTPSALICHKMGRTGGFRFHPTLRKYYFEAVQPVKTVLLSKYCYGAFYTTGLWDDLKALLLFWRNTTALCSLQHIKEAAVDAQTCAGESLKQAGLSRTHSVLASFCEGNKQRPMREDGAGHLAFAHARCKSVCVYTAAIDTQQQLSDYLKCVLYKLKQ